MMHPPAGRRPGMRPPRDSDTTARLEVGDARTLAAVYDRHAGAMYSLAMRIAGEPADAEAIVRAVFAAAWSEAARQPGRYAPDVHRLVSATRIRAIDHVRAAAPGEAASAVEGGASSGAQPGDFATLHLPDPTQGRTAEESGPADAPRMRAAFRTLPPLERLAIELAYFEGLTISRIAPRLEQTPGAANARIRSGLLRLAGRAGGRRASKPHHDLPPVRELAGLYALGALNASERAAFDAHMEVHRDAVDEVLSLLPVTRRLAWAAAPHEPPPRLRERVIETVTGGPLPGARAEETPQSPAAPPAHAGPEPAAEHGAESAGGGDTTGSAQTGGSPEARNAGTRREPTDAESGTESVAAGGREPTHAQSATEPSASGAGVELSDASARLPADTAEAVAEAAPSSPAPPAPPLREPTPTVQKATPGMQKATPTAQKKGGRRALLALAAAGLVAAGGLGLFAARQVNLATALQENLDAANTQAGIAELETAAAQRVADELRGGVGVLTATDVQMLDLAGQPAAPAARGRLFWSPSEGALITVTGLPAVPPGRVYQVWLIPGTSPTSAGLLQTDPEGRAMATVTPPDGVTEPVPAAVTLEPAGGAATPGGDVYLLGQP